MKQIPAPKEVQDLYKRINSLGQTKIIHRNLDLLSEVLDSLPKNVRYQIFDVIGFANEAGEAEFHVVISEYSEIEIRKDGWTFLELFKNYYNVTWKIIGCKELSTNELTNYQNEIAKQGYANTLVVPVK